MVSKRFHDYLSQDVQRTWAADPLSLADSIARSHGYLSLEQLMLAIERCELSAEQEENFMEDLRPLVEWALERQGTESGNVPQDQWAAIRALIDAIVHFLFGYTPEELQQLQMRWGTDRLIERVQQAELARGSRRAAMESSDPEAPAVLIRSLF